MGCLITPIASSIGVEANPNDGVSEFKRLALATFEQMKFCNVDSTQMCWIYPKNRLILLPNIDQTTLLNLHNLSCLPGDEELVHPLS